jgi:hypothetical protein
LPTKKTHIAGENFVLTTAIKICETVHGNKIAEALRFIPTSSNKIKIWTDWIGDSINSQLVSHIRQIKIFAIQPNESTDVTNYTQVMVFVHQYTIQIHEDLLFYRSLSRSSFQRMNLNSKNA